MSSRALRRANVGENDLNKEMVEEEREKSCVGGAGQRNWFAMVCVCARVWSFVFEKRVCLFSCRGKST